jgi:hypothetical protein
LTLDADSAAGGTGTLSINSGATVATTGTITLRGAAANIATGTNGAVVGGSRVLSTTASATYTANFAAGVLASQAVAVDASGNLYLADFGNNTVERFAPGSTTAGATYSSGIADPIALDFDSSGNLYVLGNTIEKFAPGSGPARSCARRLGQSASVADRNRDFPLGDTPIRSTGTAL